MFRSPMVRGVYSSPSASHLHSYALSPAQTAMAQDVTEQETWRSQTILQVGYVSVDVFVTLKIVRNLSQET